MICKQYHVLEFHPTFYSHLNLSAHCLSAVKCIVTNVLYKHLFTLLEGKPAKVSQNTMCN